jgi:Holliday junction resolvasome RuvABC endonuclease subunit
MNLIGGLDPSLTSCGIAILRRTGHGNVDIADLRSVGHKGRDGASWGDRSDRIVAQTRHVLSLIPAGVELVVIEGPAYGQHLPSTHDRGGLWWGLYTALRARGIVVGVCTPSGRAKWATGDGNAKKPAVLAAARSQWPHDRIFNHDQADALALAGAGAYRLGWCLPYQPSRGQLAAHEHIAWEGTR